MKVGKMEDMCPGTADFKYKQGVDKIGKTN